eukprot:9634859-Alexandrium_andersonii.AAC.1
MAFAVDVDRVPRLGYAEWPEAPTSPADVFAPKPPRFGVISRAHTAYATRRRAAALARHNGRVARARTAHARRNE